MDGTDKVVTIVLCGFMLTAVVISGMSMAHESTVKAIEKGYTQVMLPGNGMGPTWVPANCGGE